MGEEPTDIVLQVLVIGLVVVMLLTPFVSLVLLIIVLAK